MYLLKGYHPSDSFFLRVNDVTFECYFCGVLGMRLERLYTSVGHLVFLPSVEELVSCAPASLAQRRSREFLCHNLLNSLTRFSFKYFLTFPYKTFCPHVIIVCICACVWGHASYILHLLLQLLPAHTWNGLLSVRIQERRSEHLWKKCLCLNEATLGNFMAKHHITIHWLFIFCAIM